MLGYVFARSSLSTIYADNHTSRKVAVKLSMTVEKEVIDPDGKAVVFHVINREAVGGTRQPLQKPFPRRDIEDRQLGGAV